MMRTALLAISLLAIGSHLILGPLAFSATEPSIKLSPTAETQLYVRTLPAGAEIVVDGKSQGTSPQLIVVPPGTSKMTVELELDGHAKQAHVVKIHGGRIKRVEFELKQLPKSAHGDAGRLGPPPAPEEQQPLRSVMLVVGKDAMTFEGKEVAWKDLPALLERVPDRRRTILAIGLDAEGVTARQWSDATGRAGNLAKRLGFAYLSHVGEHPLGSKAGSPPQAPNGQRPLPEPSAKKAEPPLRSAMLVIGKDAMTFEGTTVTWKDLPALLEKVPDRRHTILAIGLDAEGVTARQWSGAMGRAANLAKRLGFAYLSDRGEHPLGSKAGTPHTAPDETAQKDVADEVGRNFGQSRVDTADPVSPGRLDLRVAATRGDGAGGSVGQTEIERCIAQLKADGPQPGRKRGDPFVWFPWDHQPRPPLITADHGGQTFVLLANTPERTMLARGAWPWSVTGVTVYQQREGHPAIGVEMDAAGGQQLGKLTETHIGRPLAILIDDRVLSAPVVRSRISRQVEITGSFEVHEAGKIARALMAGIKPPRGPVAKPQTPGEAAVRQVIADFATASAKVDKAAATKLLHPRAYNYLDDLDEIPKAIKEGLELTKIRSVAIRGDRALVVIERGGRPDDPEFAKCLVYTLVKLGGGWLIEDLDLEDEKGVAGEIRRFHEGRPAEAESAAQPGRKAGTEIEGIVLAVAGDGLLEISIGADDGLRKGHRLHVHRGGHQGTKHAYVGRIEVVRTTPDKAVCRVEQELAQSHVRKGDRVSGRLRAHDRPSEGPAEPDAAAQPGAETTQ